MSRIFRPVSQRPVRGCIEVVDDSYPASGYQAIRLSIRGDQPTIEVDQGDLDTLRVLSHLSLADHAIVFVKEGEETASIDETGAASLASLTLSGDLSSTGSASLASLHVSGDFMHTPQAMTTADFAENACDLNTFEGENGLKTFYAFVCGAGAGIANDAIITLPTPADNAGRVLYLHITNGSGKNITSLGAGRFGIDDDDTEIATADGESMTFHLFCDGAKWRYAVSVAPQ